MADQVLMEKAKESGMPYEALLQVYRRGVGAWRTNILSVRLIGTGEKNVPAPRSAKMPKEQWAYARVNAFINKKPTVFKGSDDDIRRKFGLK